MQPKPTIVKAPKGCCKYLTAGKNYKVKEVIEHYRGKSGWLFSIIDNEGITIYCNTKACCHANGDWIISGHKTDDALKLAIKNQKQLGNVEIVKELEYELQCLEQYLSENQSTTYTNVVHSELEQKAITGFNKDKRFKITE